MSQICENPECTADQVESCKETQGLEVAQVSNEAEGSCSSPHPLGPTSPKGETCTETGGLEVSEDVNKPCFPRQPMMPTSQKGETTCKKTGGLEVTQVSEDVKKPCSPHHLLMPTSPKGSCKGTQGLEVTQASEDVEEPHSPLHPLVANNPKSNIYKETQVLDVAQVSEDVKEPRYPPHPLLPSSPKCEIVKETQDLEVVQVPEDVAEPRSPPHPLLPCSPKGESYRETQGVQVAQVSEDGKEPCSSPHPLLPSSPKGESYKETQGIKVAQVSEDVEEPSSSSHPLLPSNLEEDPLDETPSTSRGPERSSALGAATASYSNRSGDGPHRQQAQVIPFNIVQGIPFNLPPLPLMQHAPDDRVSRKVDFLVNYMLYKYQMRELMSMEDMIRTVIREDEHHFHEILARANDRMEMVFGLEVRAVDPINHFYGLFIKLGLTYDGMHNHEYSFPKTGLLILILGIVFMKGNRATEEEIWEVLNPMGIIAGVPHFLFGDPRQLITQEFVREQYLECQPVPNSLPVRYEYMWGPRARAETSKMRVLEYVAKIHGGHPSVFQSQYEEALLEEEERTIAMLLERAASGSMAVESSCGMASRFPPP